MPKGARRDKGEGALFKRADGMWCATVELPRGLDGKRRRKVIARKDRGEAQRELRALRATFEAQGDLSTRSLTVEQWMKRYMDDIAPQKMRPSTLAGARSVVDGFIVPLLGKKKLDRLSADDVRRLHRTVQATPADKKLRALPLDQVPDDAKRLSSTYALNAHNILSAALTAAMRDGKVAANVCTLVDKPRARVIQDNALTAEQVKQLVAHLAGRPDAALWMTFLFTGARRGEVLGLEVERVGPMIDLSWQLQAFKKGTTFSPDFEYRHLVGTRYLTRPKSRAGWRIVPAHPTLAAILDRHIGGRTSGLVFLNARGEPFYPSTISKAWKDLLADAGLPGHVTLHGARHTFVDMLYASGARESVVMDMLGHSTRSVTRGYRVHKDQAAMSSAVTDALRAITD